MRRSFAGARPWLSWMRHGLMRRLAIGAVPSLAACSAPYVHPDKDEIDFRADAATCSAYASRDPATLRSGMAHGDEFARVRFQCLRELGWRRQSRGSLVDRGVDGGR